MAIRVGLGKGTRIIGKGFHALQGGLDRLGPITSGGTCDLKPRQMSMKARMPTISLVNGATTTLMSTSPASWRMLRNFRPTIRSLPDRSASPDEVIETFHRGLDDDGGVVRIDQHHAPSRPRHAPEFPGHGHWVGKVLEEEAGVCEVAVAVGKGDVVGPGLDEGGVVPTLAGRACSGEVEELRVCVDADQPSLRHHAGQRCAEQARSAADVEDGRIGGDAEAGDVLEFKRESDFRLRRRRTSSALRSSWSRS